MQEVLSNKEIYTKKQKEKTMYKKEENLKTTE